MSPDSVLSMTLLRFSYTAPTPENKHHEKKWIPVLDIMKNNTSIRSRKTYSSNRKKGTGKYKTQNV